MAGDDENRVVGDDESDESEDLDLRGTKADEPSFRSRTGNVAQWGASTPESESEGDKTADDDIASAQERWARVLAGREAVSRPEGSDDDNDSPAQDDDSSSDVLAFPPVAPVDDADDEGDDYSDEENGAPTGDDENAPANPFAFPGAYAPQGPSAYDEANEAFAQRQPWDFGGSDVGGELGGANPYRATDFDQPRNFEDYENEGFDEEYDDEDDEEGDYDDGTGGGFQRVEPESSSLSELIDRLPPWAVPAGVIVLSLILALFLRPLFFGGGGGSGAEKALENFWVAANKDDGAKMHDLLCAEQASQATPQLLTESFKKVGPVKVTDPKAGKEQETVNSSGQPIVRVTVSATAEKEDGEKGPFTSLMIKEGDDWKYCGLSQ